MDKIKIMHIAGSLNYGGAEIFLVSLLKNLNRERFDITACYVSGGGPLESELTASNIEVIKLPALTRMNLPLCFYRLFRIVKIYKPDIVHTHLFEPGVLGRTVARVIGVPVIIAHEHGMTLWKRKPHIMYEKWANRFTDMRVAVSEDIRQNRISREGTAPEKIITIPNGVDTVYFDPSRWPPAASRAELGLGMDIPIVGTVARLTPVKGLHYLLEAVREISWHIPNVALLIVGDGPLRGGLEQRSRKLGIGDRVIFTGYRSDTAKMLATMDIFVLSSIKEGMPISLLEAMAMQRFIVATRVGGIPEVIQDKISGVLVPPSDPHQLAKAIISSLENRERRNSIAVNARKRAVECFSIKTSSKRIGELYLHLWEARKRRRK